MTDNEGDVLHISGQPSFTPEIKLTHIGAENQVVVGRDAFAECLQDVQCCHGRFLNILISIERAVLQKYLGKSLFECQGIQTKSDVLALNLE